MTACKDIGYPTPERIRAIEQIKRLFAVMMGLAATACVTNIFRLYHSLPEKEPSIIIILICAGVIFFSLIIPFYLSIERHLELAYLRKDDPTVPRFALVYDIIAMVLTSLWFIILANTFPVKLPGLTVDDVVERGVDQFVTALHFLLAFDIISLLVALSLMRVGLLPNADVKMDHRIRIWITFDLVSIIALLILLVIIGETELNLKLVFASILLSAASFARFVYEIVRDREFYLP